MTIQDPTPEPLVTKDRFWSERMIFGSTLIGLYGIIVVLGVVLLHKDSLSIVHDAMLGLGPLLGVIVNAIWKTDKTERQVAATAAVLAAKAPDLSGPTK